MIVFSCGVLISISIYLLLEPNKMRRVFGVLLLSSTINLIVLICGRLNAVHPAFVGDTEKATSNPLPQALILTAIVIGIGLMAFLATLLKKLAGDQDE